MDNKLLRRFPDIHNRMLAIPDRYPLLLVSLLLTK